MNILRFYHTVRHLRLRQIVGQARSTLKARTYDPSRFAARRSPSFPGCQWRPIASFLPPGSQLNSTDAILAGKMTFINQELSVGWAPDWECQEAPKLWSYNLHYFEWIWAFGDTDFDRAKEVTEDWIARHHLRRNSVGWDPYPTSLRLINWCTYFFGTHRALTLDDPEFVDTLWKSIWLQSEWLSDNIEYRLLGNHLMENAAALALVGACFDGVEAARMGLLGRKLLEQQVVEQIGLDGLHFEQSPMYHSRILYVFLTLLNCGDESLRSIIAPVINPMLDALDLLCHPDGKIALLNDSAFGVYSEPDQLRSFAVAIGLLSEEAPTEVYGPWALPEAGYYGFRSENGSYVVCDAGGITPSYIPGHAHADMLSFELSFRGSRVIVDAGVHDYENGELRAYCRSTKAHNTVGIGGQDQAEMWGAFRVARRGCSRDVSWLASSDGFELDAWHDGYQRLPGSPKHCRSFVWRDGDSCLTVTDRIVSTAPVECVTYIHLHPSCRIAEVGDRAVCVCYPNGRFSISFAGSGKIVVGRSLYHPEFYTTNANIVIEYVWKTTSEHQRSQFVIQDIA